MMRLQKFLALAGVASRRKSEELILQGKIKVNGIILKQLGTQVNENRDTVEYEGKIIKVHNNKIYIALNKPLNYISSTSSVQGKSILELLKKSTTHKQPSITERLYPVGRLDKDSRGLIILTNDGDFAYKLTQAKYEYEKEYEVEINKKFNSADKKVLERGMTIEGKSIRGIKVKILTSKKLQMILKEGINRQIRKMLAQLEYKVLDLKRIRIAKLKIADLDLKEGEWKKINKSDII